MKTTKLIQLLCSKSTQELRQFRDFLASPYFNKRQELIEFYNVLLEWAPDFAENELEKEAVWKRFAPERKLDEKEFGYLMSFTYKLFEHFIAVQSFEKDNVAKAIRVSTHHLENRLEKHYRAAMDDAKRQLTKESFRDAEWQLKAWQIAKLEVLHFYSSKSRKPGTSFARAIQHLDTFYLDSKLEMAGEVLNFNQILDARLDTSFIDDVKRIQEASQTQEPTIRIRELVLATLEARQDDASFLELKSILHLVPELFPTDKAKGIFVYAENFCIRRIKLGETRFQSELFQIYEQSLDLGIMYENNKLSPWKFKNVCSVALQLEKFEWVQNFIESQKGYLETKFRSDAVAYNLANLYFHQCQYERALKTLNKVEFTDVFYALDSRRILVKIYLEREDYDSLFFLLSAFRSYLRRNKVVSRKNRAAYKNFITWTDRISRGRQNGTTSLWEKYIVRINNTTPTIDRLWLIEKCRESI